MKAIMYHYVRLPEVNLPWFKYLHIDDFVRQLDWFEEEYGFVTKEDFFKSLNTGKPSPGIVLTFDDGLKDHYRFVFPELQRRNLWAFFFVSTGMYTSRKLVNVHRVHLLLGAFGGKMVFEALKKLVKENMFTCVNTELFRNTYTNQLNDDHTVLVKRWLNYFIDEKYQAVILDRLMQQFFHDEDRLVNDFYLNEGEIKLMQDAGMVIGSHTVTHPVMSKLDRGEQEKQIQQSFRWIAETVTYLPFKTFCYPYGDFHSFNRDTEEILDNEGVVCSFNVEARDISTGDLLGRKQALPRYDCNTFPHGQIRGLNK